MDTLIAKARALLQSSQEAQALQLLAPEVKQHPDSVPLLQIFGEALLEANDVDTAYTVLSKAVELDAEAAQGVEKFLYLGQIVGGRDGCAYIDVALVRLQQQLQLVVDNSEHDPELVALAKVYATSEQLAAYLVRKLNQGLFAEIEIWMTDLCMEPEAEHQCEELIAHSLALDNTNPEAYSLLALIRISQQKQPDAEEALRRAWELFRERKLHLEKQQSGDGEDVSFEYVELVQPLLGLARFAIELALYDLVPDVCAAVADINDNCLDCFYYDALAHLLCAKKLYAQLHAVDGDYRELDAAVLTLATDDDIQASVADARLALTQGYRVINSADAEASDPEVMELINELLAAFGGPVMAELAPPRRTDDQDDDGWEDEIPSDGE